LNGRENVALFRAEALKGADARVTIDSIDAHVVIRERPDRLDRDIFQQLGVQEVAWMGFVRLQTRTEVHPRIPVALRHKVGAEKSFLTTRKAKSDEVEQVLRGLESRHDGPRRPIVEIPIFLCRTSCQGGDRGSACIVVKPKKLYILLRTDSEAHVIEVQDPKVSRLKKVELAAVDGDVAERALCCAPDHGGFRRVRIGREQDVSRLNANKLKAARLGLAPGVVRSRHWRIFP
jgi:hypothetical protein